MTTPLLSGDWGRQQHISQKLPLFIQGPMPGLPGSIKSVTNDSTHTEERGMESIWVRVRARQEDGQNLFLLTTGLSSMSHSNRRL